MTGTDDRLVAIAARADAASPGPWPYAETLWAGRARDAEFIAHAREDIPWLLSQLRDARAENERQAEMARSINCDLVEERDMLAARLVEVEKERDEQRKLMPLIEREAQLASAEARGRRA